MEDNIKSAVIMFGIHDHAIDSERILFAEQGRIAKAVEVAFKHMCYQVFICSQAESSQLQRTETSARTGLSGTDIRLSVVKDGKTTTGEAEHVINYCLKHEIGVLHLVSSPGHIDRCCKEARVARRNAGATDKITLVIHECEEDYAGADPSGPLIIEYPHFGPQTELPEELKLINLCKHFFKLPKNKLKQVLEVFCNIFKLNEC